MKRHYDLVVVDAAATGHVVAQLAAPTHIRELVKVGMVRDQTGWMLDILGDSARTGAIVVASPEEMPVNETIELAGRIKTDTNVDLAAVVVNRVLPELFGRGEEECFDEIRQPARRRRPRVGGGRSSAAGARRGRARGTTSPDAGRPSGAARATGSTRARTCSTSPSCSPAITACARRSSSPKRSARSSGF